VKASKGEAYERDVAEALAAELAGGRLGLVPDCVRLRRKPSYFSPNRGRPITFDLSVEVFREDAVVPYWIWLWECKNYAGPVQIEDVEEFHAKLEQIGADRTKGTIVTTEGFAKGAFAYAKSKGIGLFRYVAGDVLVSLLDFLVA